MTEADWWAATNPLPLIDWLFFDTPASDRKLRLFAAACCRRTLHHLRHLAPPVESMIEWVEAFADGKAPAGAFVERREAVLREWNTLDDELDRHLPGRVVDPATVSEANLDHTDFWFVAQCATNAALCLPLDAEEPRRVNPRYRSRAFYRGGASHRIWDTRPFPFAVAAGAAEAAQGAMFEGCSDGQTAGMHDQVRLLHDIFGPLPFRAVAAQSAWLTPDVLRLARTIYETRPLADLPILADALEEAGCTDADILAHLRSPGSHVPGCWPLDLILGRS